MTRRSVSIIFTACILYSTVASGQAHRDQEPDLAAPQTILLWEHGAPGALGQADEDKPSITLYLPWGPNRSGTP